MNYACAGCALTMQPDVAFAHLPALVGRILVAERRMFRSIRRRAEAASVAGKRSLPVGDAAVADFRNDVWPDDSKR